MKLFKLLCCGLLTLGISLLFLPKVEASTIVNVGEITETSLIGNATHYQATISSYYKGETKASYLTPHLTNWVELNTSIKDSSIRVVSYSKGLSYNWKGGKPTEIAKKYEEENPGWIVVAGINGDFFHIDTNCEPASTFMQEGEFYKSNKFYFEGCLGFFEDGSYIYGNADSSSCEYLERLKDDGTYEILDEIKVVDKTPSTSGISLLTRFAITTSPYANVAVKSNFSYDLTGYKIVKVKYDIERLDRETKFVYVKGEVVGTMDNVSTLMLDDAESISYLVAKDDSLSTLKVGDKVRCQAELQGDWVGVTNITGVYGHILSNGTIQDHAESDDPYVTANKNRTIMGFKEDGTPVIMTIDLKSFGATYLECAEFLQRVGCVNGYLFDGGGSSLMFIRNKNNDFEIVNVPSDGSERSDANAVLLVMKDPGFEIATSNVGPFSVTTNLNITNSDYFKDVKDVKITINGVTKENEDNLVFDDLEENTTYEVAVSFKINVDGKDRKSVLYSSFTTGTISNIKNGLSVASSTKNTITVKRDLTIPTANQISDVVVHIGDSTFNMGSKAEMVCDGLIEDEEYSIYFTYNVTDPETGKKINVSTSENPITYRTLSYNPPQIVTFNKTGDNSFEYKYVDSDRVVTSAAIYLDGKEYSKLTSKSGFIDVDFDKTKTHKIKIVLEYSADGKNYTLESDPITIEAEVTPEPTPVEPEKTKKKCGKKSAELVIALISISTLLSFILRRKQ